MYRINSSTLSFLILVICILFFFLISLDKFINSADLFKDLTFDFTNFPYVLFSISLTSYLYFLPYTDFRLDMPFFFWLLQVKLKSSVLDFVFPF